MTVSDPPVCFLAVSHQYFTDLVLNSLPHNPNILMTQRKKTLENIVGKGENAGNQHFLLFPQYFLSFPNQMLIFD